LTIHFMIADGAGIHAAGVSFRTNCMHRIKKTAQKRSPVELLIFATVLLCGGCSRSTAPIDRSSADNVPAGPVTVVIDFGDSTVRREIESVPEGTTVAQVMTEITDPPVKLIGSGAMTFVDSIGDLGTTGGKGWTFRVDGKWADRGIGAYQLTPPALIEWSHRGSVSAAESAAEGTSQDALPDAAD
jgi:hypothetical protein